MLTRLRCLTRLHRWQPMEIDDGGRFKRCGDCPKWRRIDKDAGKDLGGNTMPDIGAGSGI